MGEERSRWEEASYFMQRANTLLLLGSIFFLGGIGVITSGLEGNINIFGIEIPKEDFAASLVLWGFFILFAGVHGYFLAEKFRGFTPIRNLFSKLPKELGMLMGGVIILVGLYTLYIVVPFLFASFQYIILHYIMSSSSAFAFLCPGIFIIFIIVGYLWADMNYKELLSSRKNTINKNKDEKENKDN